MARALQLSLELKQPVHWGGSRLGAGRKAAARARVLHRRRENFPGRLPGLVTIRVRKDVPSLRIARLVQALERGLRRGSERGEFRVVHYSVQHDHVHLLVEAADAPALARGMKSVTARLARAVNRVHGRRGPVVDGRFHHRTLVTPREVRSALAYVLLNSRKHLAQREPAALSFAGIDPASSGRWFEGWSKPLPPPADRPAVSGARTWLLRAGWRRHGLIRADEVPGGRKSRTPRAHPA
jgi:REP element-mobilizing transposase RayT